MTQTTARVLLVDDERSQFLYTHRLLESLGPRYALEWASTYDDGLDRIMRGGIDAALVDYHLGSRSGLELAREAIERQCDVPLVILTGQGDESVDLQAMDIGAADYLDKADLTTQLLDRTLRYAMRHQEALRCARQREAHFRALIENSADAIVLLDANGTVEYASESARRVSGFSPDELLARDAFDGVLTDDRGAGADLLARCLREPGVTVSSEHRVRHRDGTTRHREVVLVNRLGDPAVRAIVANVRDVTDRKQLEERFLQSQKIEAVGRLAGGIAHDFNNLLLAITGYAEMVSDRLGPLHPSATHVQRLWKAAESAASLTRQLLAFSRRQVLQPQMIDLNQIVRHIGSLMERIIGEEIQLETRLTTPLSRVSADPAQVEQVVMNLALNARDAMPGGGRLTIETANVDLDEHYVAQHHGAMAGPHVMLAISDSGVGMDEAVQERLFEPFFTTKDRGKGTGLGLATIYGIVKQSGGSIWVYSEPGKGSCFKVYLPAAGVADLQIDETPRVEAIQVTGGNETVLVVEDQPDVAAVSCEMLTACGYQVLKANGGAEAIAISDGHAGTIHLLLTDVVMPEMSGRQVAARLRAARPDLRVVYTSGYTDNAIVHHGVLDPGLAFLQKPFSSTALAMKLREVLDRPEAPGV